MKILLVDDHILFAKSLSIALCDNPEIEQFSSTKDIQDLEKQIFLLLFSFPLTLT